MVPARYYNEHRNIPSHFPASGEAFARHVPEYYYCTEAIQKRSIPELSIKQPPNSLAKHSLEGYKPNLFLFLCASPEY
jgi:hypothetical protein